LKNEKKAKIERFVGAVNTLGEIRLMPKSSSSWTEQLLSDIMNRNQRLLPTPCYR